MEFFASPDQTDHEFISFLTKAGINLSDWFATTTKRGPSPSSFDLPDIAPSRNGLSQNQLLDELKVLMAGSYQPSHPGALAHLDPPPLTASIVGELISAGLNNNLLAEELSPSITKLERGICNWFVNQLSMPETSGGVAVSGGSLSNLMALLVARSNVENLYDSSLVVMASAEAHVSIDRAISVMGLPPESLSKVSTDHQGQIIIESLKEQYMKNKSQGKTCFAVVATAGTTVRGAIDPLNDISDFCKSEGLWLHVDAAIGGVFALTPTTSSLLNSISNANSVCVNPQKVLGITKTSSLLLVSNKEDLFNCFSTGFPYIEPSNEGDFQGGEIGLQGTRSAEVIKLWLGLRQLGENGIKILLDKALERRLYLNSKIDHSKLEVISGPLHLLAITPVDFSKHESEEWSNTTRKKLLEHDFMLSRPQYKGKSYLKAVMGNPHTKFHHIDQLADILNQSI